MSQSKAELQSTVTKIIDSLPQRQFIADETAKRWVVEVIKLEADRAIWHAHRAKTIGGSEAGEFLLAAMGERPAYNSLDEIWRQKMLIDLPGRPNIYMRRGTAMEDLARRVFLKLTGHKSILDTEEVEQAFSKPHALFNHIGGNPDEVVDVAKMRVIADFKVRNNLDEEKGVSVVNGAQLHWYGMIHESNLKKRPDGYCLAELDIPADMMDDLMKNPPTTDEGWDRIANDVAAINRPGFGMKTQYFKHNEMLADNLVRLTKQWWDKYVMTGTPYAKPKPSLPKEMTDLDKKRVEEAQNRFTKHKIAETAAKENASDARREVDEIARKYEIKDWPFQSAGLSAGYSKTFDSEKAAAALISAGVDRKTLCTATDTPDTDRMIQTLKSNGLLGDSQFKVKWDDRAIKSALKEHKIDIAKFDGLNLRMGLSRKKEDLPVRELLEKKMSQHIDDFMNEPKDLQQSVSLVDTNNEVGQEDEQDSLKLA